jgi:hypothetical protein
LVAAPTRWFHNVRIVGERIARLPRGVPAAAGTLFVAFWLTTMTAFVGVHGSVLVRDGQYVLDDHGRITVVDRATYERQLALEERIALGVLGGFGVGAATLCLAAAGWRPGSREPAQPTAMPN